MKKVSIEIKSMIEEPFVYLETGEELVEWGKEEEIIYNQNYRQKEKLKFYRAAFDFIYSHSIKGDYFEFGVHKARTFRMALTEARKKNFHKMRFLAFDSFKGLPDYGINNINHNEFFIPETLKTDESLFEEIIRKHGIYADRVKIISGYYENALNKNLTKKLKKENYIACVVTLDCDLYQSYKVALNFIEDFLQEGTIIYLDDYRVSYKGNPEKGPALAFKQFKKRSKFKFQEFLNVGWFGKSFIVYK